MSARAWQDRMVGDRMAVDRAFNERIEESRFNRQQWGLVMTAVEFDVEQSDDPERARLVANTSKLPHVMGELDAMESRAGGMGGGGDDSGGGLVDSIKGSLGLGGGGDDETRAAAEELTGEYASRLQARLEDQGKWAEIRAAAAE